MTHRRGNPYLWTIVAEGWVVVNWVHEMIDALVGSAHGSRMKTCQFGGGVSQEWEGLHRTERTDFHELTEDELLALDLPQQLSADAPVVAIIGIPIVWCLPRVLMTGSPNWGAGT
jgi:hypothetical protein